MRNTEKEERAMTEPENKSDWQYDFDEEYGENNENVEETPVLSRREQEAQVKETLGELIAGIVIVNLLALGLGNLVLHGNLNFSIGLLAGAVTSVVLSIYIYRSILVATDLGEQGATGYMKKTAVFRMVIMIAVIGIAAVVLRGYGAFGAIFGIFTLKFAAFLWPVIHKYNPSNRNKK